MLVARPRFPTHRANLSRPCDSATRARADLQRDRTDPRIALKRAVPSAALDRRWLLACDRLDRTIRHDLTQFMDRSIIDTVQRILAERRGAPEEIRDDLLARLDLAHADDADANDLRFILEKMDMPAALDEFQMALSQIRARELRR